MRKSVWGLVLGLFAVGCGGSESDSGEQATGELPPVLSATSEPSQSGASDAGVECVSLCIRKTGSAKACESVCVKR